MTNPERKEFRSFSTDPSDLLIDAAVCDKNNPGVFHTITFKVASIQYLTDVNEKASAIVLNGGTVIPVACPRVELKQMVYNPDLAAGLNLDLTPLTGQVAADIVAPALADEFNKKSGLTVHALLRKSSSDKVIHYTFSERDISAYEPVEGTRAKCGESVMVYFNAASGKKGPFDDGKAMLDMPYQDFVERLTKAKSAGSSAVDFAALFVAHPGKYGFDCE